MSRIFLENAAIIATMDPDIGDVEHGNVVIENGRIKEIVHTIPQEIDGKRINMSGCVVVPGFINLHHHFYQTLTRAYPDAVDTELFDWLVSLYPIWAGLHTESIELSTKLAMAELLLSGCTTTVDHHYVFPAAYQEKLIDTQVGVARELGMRFVATRGSMSRGKTAGGLPPDQVVQDESHIIKDSRRLIESYHDPSPFAMIQISLAPCSPFSISPKLMQETANLAEDLDVRLHTHLAETKDELDYCRRIYGCSPVQLLRKTGWLSSRTWVAHGIHFTDEEITILGDNRVGIAHCPTSNMRLGSGIAPVLALRSAGCPVGLGVDGSASNDSSHMLMELRQSLLIGRLGAGPSDYSVRLPLELATIGGAQCLGRATALGRISPGYAADIAAFDIMDIYHSGAIDPIAGLILCAPREVRHLFIAGEHIVDSGKIRGLNLPSLVEQHREESDRLVQSLGISDKG